MPSESEDSLAAPGSSVAEPPEAGGRRRQSWTFGLFSILTTAAILIVALATPVALNGVLGSYGDWADGVARPAGTQAITWLHLLSFQAAAVLLTFAMADVARGSLPGLGWQPPAARGLWVRPLLVTIAVTVVTSLIAFTFFEEQIERDLEPIRRMVQQGPLWLAFIALAIGAPLSEELLFRGYLLQRLRQTRLGFIGAALVANTGWALLHFDYSWLSLADVFLAGLLFSWALWRTGSIWVPIAFHAIYNASVFFILLIPPSETAVPGVIL
ncbi:MAG: CPBP family intramembrane metalloprotease [Alphaproteobacteria bacterium]|nr:CPBP family intramembrane metalloprotease [Alphaproteobacteria bacterium]